MEALDLAQKATKSPKAAGSDVNVVDAPNIKILYARAKAAIKVLGEKKDLSPEQQSQLGKINEIITDIGTKIAAPPEAAKPPQPPPPPPPRIAELARSLYGDLATKDTDKLLEETLEALDLAQKATKLPNPIDGSTPAKKKPNIKFLYAGAKEAIKVLGEKKDLSANQQAQLKKAEKIVADIGGEIEAPPEGAKPLAKTAPPIGAGSKPPPGKTHLELFKEGAYKLNVINPATLNQTDDVKGAINTALTRINDLLKQATLSAEDEAKLAAEYAKAKIYLENLESRTLNPNEQKELDVLKLRFQEIENNAIIQGKKTALDAKVNEVNTGFKPAVAGPAAATGPAATFTPTTARGGKMKERLIGGKGLAGEIKKAEDLLLQIEKNPTWKDDPMTAVLREQIEKSRQRLIDLGGQLQDQENVLTTSGFEKLSRDIAQEMHELEKTILGASAENPNISPLGKNSIQRNRNELKVEKFYENEFYYNENPVVATKEQFQPNEGLFKNVQDAPENSNARSEAIKRLGEAMQQTCGTVGDETESKDEYNEALEATKANLKAYCADNGIDLKDNEIDTIAKQCLPEFQESESADEGDTF
ncbi:MAG: hypothetical protein LBB05_04140 [Puniceicoccales bacterium]|nr:hypothetical protein [Puniceicoccales bacterium]